MILLLLCVYIPSTGYDNNAQCLAIAVNALAGAMFACYGAFINQKQRMKEFLVVKFHVVCRRHCIEALN